MTCDHTLFQKQLQPVVEVHGTFTYKVSTATMDDLTERARLLIVSEIQSIEKAQC